MRKNILFSISLFVLTYFFINSCIQERPFFPKYRPPTLTVFHDTLAFDTLKNNDTLVEEDIFTCGLLLDYTQILSSVHNINITLKDSLGLEYFHATWDSSTILKKSSIDSLQPQQLKKLISKEKHSLKKTGLSFLTISLVLSDTTLYYSIKFYIKGITPKFLKDTITISPILPVIDKPVAFSAICSGSRPLTVQWYKRNSQNPIVTHQSTDTLSSTRPFYDTLAFNPLSLKDTGLYLCILSNRWGADTSSLLQMSYKNVLHKATFLNNKDLIIKGSVQNDSTIILSSVAYGSKPLAYQWFNNSNILLSATDSFLKLKSLSYDSSYGYYFCVVNNHIGSDTTNPFFISVKSRPFITTKEKSLVVNGNLSKNSRAIFQITAKGHKPFIYKWFKNNQIIAGSLGNTHEISSVSFSDEALYHCIVSNDSGSDTSRQYLLKRNNSAPVWKNNTIKLVIEGNKNKTLPLQPLVSDLENDSLLFTILSENSKLCLIQSDTLTILNPSSFPLGEYPVKIIVSDSRLIDTLFITLSYNKTNNKPFFVDSLPKQTHLVFKGRPLLIPLKAVDTDNDPLNYFVVPHSLPSNQIFSIQIKDSLLTVSTDSDAHAIYTLVIAASDKKDTVMKPITVGVNHVNFFPQAIVINSPTLVRDSGVVFQSSAYCPGTIEAKQPIRYIKALCNDQAIAIVTNGLSWNIDLTGVQGKLKQWNELFVYFEDTDATIKSRVFWIFIKPRLPDVSSIDAFIKSDISGRNITVTWNTIEYCDRYKLYRSTSGLNDSYICLSDSTIFSFRDTGLMPSREYFYTVRGYYRITSPLLITDSTTQSKPLQIKTANRFIRYYGGSDSDIGNSIFQTSDSGFIIAGSTKSFGAGLTDIYLVKTTPHGDTLWTKTFGGISDDACSQLQITQDGGLIIAGNTYSFGAGGSDVYLIKTDPFGVAQQSRILGFQKNEISYGIIQTNDRGYIVIGSTNSMGSGLADIFLSKTNASMDTLWTRTIGYEKQERGKAVLQTIDGGYCIAGFRMDKARDIYLVQTNALGDTVWTKTYGGVFNEEINAMQYTSDGGVILIGYTHSWGSGSADIYLIKTTLQGEMLWSKTYGGLNDDEGCAVQQTSDGGYILVGFTNSFGSGSADVYLIKTNATGEVLWTRTYGGSGDDRGYGVKQTSDGGYCVTGYWNSPPSRAQDVLLIKTDALGNVE